MVYSEPPEGFDARFEVVSCFMQVDGRFLLLRRQDHKPQGDTWGVPAGKIDEGETPLTAMLREIQEETGHISHPDTLVWHSKVYVRFPEYDFVYHMFSQTLPEAPEIRLNPGEHKEYRWVRPDEATDLPLIGGMTRCIELFYA